MKDSETNRIFCINIKRNIKLSTAEQESMLDADFNICVMNSVKYSAFIQVVGRYQAPKTSKTKKALRETRDSVAGPQWEGERGGPPLPLPSFLVLSVKGR